MQATETRPNVQHSMGSAEWYTPHPIVEAVRELFTDDLILDPASCEKANEVIQAHTYFTAEDDGLSKPWYIEGNIHPVPSAVMLNPPGGRGANNIPLPRLFWEKLTQEINDGHVYHAVYIAYSIEQFQQFQEYGIDECMICIPPKRLRYLKPDTNGELKPMTSPTHASGIVYVPGAKDVSPQFVRLFRAIGGIYKPAYL